MQYYKEIGGFDFVALGQKNIWLVADVCNALACFEYGAEASTEKLRAFNRYQRLAIIGEKRGLLLCDSSGEPLRDEYKDTYNNDDGKVVPNLKYCYAFQEDVLQALKQLPHFDLPSFEKVLSLDAFMKKQTAKRNASIKWGQRAAMEVETKRYVHALLDAGCKCDHGQVAGYAWDKYLVENDVVKLLTDSIREKFEKYGFNDYHMYLSKDNLVKIARDIFVTRASDRIYKVSLHKRIKDCKINHLSI